MPSRVPRAALLTLALLSALSGPAHAHPEMADALARFAAQLAAHPTDATVFLERGELYAKFQDYVAAEANYLRAAELAPRLPRLALARGALALVTKHFAEARAFLDQAVAAAPADAEARIQRARTFAELGEKSAALADFAVAFLLLPEPPPELFLERAALFSSPSAALASLDEGLTRLGPVMSLHLRALDLELALGRTEAALARLDTLTAAAERRELWLKRRGDILAAAGRTVEARTAYTAALAALHTLPVWLLQSPDTLHLSAELSRLAATTR